MGDKIIYPEMLEYAWVKDMDRVRANSKYVKQDYSGEPITADQLPKSPVNLVLAVIKEAMAYPEVMEAHAPEISSEHDNARKMHLLMWFDDYLLNKYGNTPDPRKEVARFLRKIAKGTYKNINDPKLIEDLLANPFVCADDGKEYDQLPAVKNE